MMEVVMEEGGDISGCSSTTTTTLDDDIGGCAWADWAPIVDWGMLSGGDDFHGLMESMAQADLDDERLPITVMDDDANGMSGGPTPTCSSSSSPGSPRELEDDGRGLRLVHLLMAAAETLGGPPEGRELARVILVRLKQLATPTATAAAAGASNMERLAAHFADALQSLIDGPSGRHRDDRPPPAAAVAPPHAAGDVLAAFQLLQDMSPYVKFGHFTANQAILEAVAGDRRVHVVDYDIMEGIQWASLMQALASRKDGPPAPHLRITAITRSGGSGGGKRSIGTVQETGRRLAAFAASIGQPFSFSQCRLDADENFRPTGVKIVKGEALVVNCMLHLPHSPHRSSASISSFLSGSSTLSPRLVTLVEEEEEEEAAKQSGFVGRFMEALYRYSAVCDSLEAGFPMQGRARGLVERVFLGPRIAGAVARAYNGRGGEGWGKWMTESGFRRVPITFFNQCQARLLLGLFHDGYRVEEVALNKLVLAWKSRRLLSASVWSPPAVAGGGGGGGGREDSDTLMLDSSPSSA